MLTILVILRGGEIKTSGRHFHTGTYVNQLYTSSPGSFSATPFQDGSQQ